jgi:hypothetical protein
MEDGLKLNDYLWNLVRKKKDRWGILKPSSLADTITGWSLGAEGSSVVSSLYSLEGGEPSRSAYRKVGRYLITSFSASVAYGAVQIMALVLTSVVSLGQDPTVKSGWRQLFLGKMYLHYP